MTRLSNPWNGSLEKGRAGHRTGGHYKILDKAIKF